jgi:hypothetical protein
LRGLGSAGLKGHRPQPAAPRRRGLAGPGPPVFRGFRSWRSGAGAGRLTPGRRRFKRNGSVGRRVTGRGQVAGRNRHVPGSNEFGAGTGGRRPEARSQPGRPDGQGLWPKNGKREARRRGAPGPDAAGLSQFPAGKAARVTGRRGFSPLCAFAAGRVWGSRFPGLRGRARYGRRQGSRCRRSGARPNLSSPGVPGTLPGRDWTWLSGSGRYVSLKGGGENVAGGAHNGASLDAGFRHVRQGQVSDSLRIMKTVIAIVGNYEIRRPGYAFIAERGRDRGETCGFSWKGRAYCIFRRLRYALGSE